MHTSLFVRLPGCRIEVVAPSSPVPVDRMNRGADLLRRWGADVHISQQTAASDSYLAGSDELRSTALTQALMNPQNDVIWAARGGYGVVRLLARGLPQKAPANAPWVVGFSDISLLHLALSQRGWPCVHGPNLTTLADLQDEDQRRLQTLLFEGKNPRFEGLRCIVPAQVTAPVIPINWTVLCSVIGTPFLPDLTGSILLLEDVHESAYRLDRNLMQLIHTPWFSGLKAVLFGDLGGADEDNRLVNSILEAMQAADMPSAFGMPVGHAARLAPIRVGWNATLDSASGTLLSAEL